MISAGEAAGERPRIGRICGVGLSCCLFPIGPGEEIGEGRASVVAPGLGGTSPESMEALNQALKRIERDTGTRIQLVDTTGTVI